jgi:hypothetical protein
MLEPCSIAKVARGASQPATDFVSERSGCVSATQWTRGKGGLFSILNCGCTTPGRVSESVHETWGN